MSRPTTVFAFPNSDMSMFRRLVASATECQPCRAVGYPFEPRSTAIGCQRRPYRRVPDELTCLLSVYVLTSR